MSGVDYPKVIDHLTDVIKELNQPCVAEAPAAPAERTAEERKQDAADVLRALLHELEGGGAGGAAAEHGASAQKFLNSGLQSFVNSGNNLGRPVAPKPAAAAAPKPFEFDNDQGVYRKGDYLNTLYFVRGRFSDTNGNYYHIGEPYKGYLRFREEQLTSQRNR